jgi:dCMP deaminase
MIPSWDKYFMDMLPLIAARSKDPNTKTGCLIVGPDHEIRTTGYNSFPRHIHDSVPERLERPEKYFWIEHAERNAIYNAARVGIPLVGCTLYLNWLSCMDCARAIIQVGIVRVAVDRQEHERKRSPKWEPDFVRVEQLYREAGTELSWWER